MGEYAEVALVGRLAEAFSHAGAAATLRLLPVNGADAAEQLERGAIDVAAAHLRAMPPTIETTLLFRDPFVVVARKGHPITKAPLTVEAYAAQNHVLVSPRGDRAARSTASSSITASAAASRSWSRPISPSPPRSPPPT